MTTVKLSYVPSLSRSKCQDTSKNRISNEHENSCVSKVLMCTFFLFLFLLQYFYIILRLHSHLTPLKTIVVDVHSEFRLIFNLILKIAKRVKKKLLNKRMKATLKKRENVPKGGSYLHSSINFWLLRWLFFFSHFTALAANGESIKSHEGFCCL